MSFLLVFLRLMEEASRKVEEELLAVAQSCCRCYEFGHKLGEGGFGFVFEGTR